MRKVEAGKKFEITAAVAARCGGERRENTKG
jgi:hypothetical protein